MGRQNKKSVVQDASNSNDPGYSQTKTGTKRSAAKKQLGSGKQKDHEASKKQPKQMSRKVNHVENNSNDPGDSQTGKAQKKSAANGSEGQRKTKILKKSKKDSQPNRETVKLRPGIYYKNKYEYSGKDYCYYEINNEDVQASQDQPQQVPGVNATSNASRSNNEPGISGHDVDRFEYF